jgi:hypothetical protein
MIKWKGRTWETQEGWGNVHPDYPYMYTSDECTYVKDGNLILKTELNPKYIPDYGYVKFAKGLAMCMDKFYFGHYKIVVTLPKGNLVWPAIWLYGQDNWPPEIDIMEGYSSAFGRYFNISTTNFKSFFKSLFRPYKIESNYHIDPTGGLGTDRVRLGYFPNLSKPVVFEMIWKPHKIVMKANGIVYSQLKGDKMKHFQKPMRFLLNNAIRYDSMFAGKSEFVIHDFSYNSF